MDRQANANAVNGEVLLISSWTRRSLTIWHPDLSILHVQTLLQEMVINSTANQRKRCEACLIESDGHFKLWNPCKIFELVVIFQKILVFKTQLA